MRLRLSDCIYSKSPAAGDAKNACVAGYVQSFEADLNFRESEEKDMPWLVRLFTSRKVLDFGHMQYGQARNHLATARTHIQKGRIDNAIDEILLAKKISTSADEEYSDELRRSIDRGSGAAKVLLATGTSLVVIGTAGGAAAYIGGGAATVYGTSTVGGLLAVTGFSTMAGAGGGLLAGGVLAGTRSLAMGVPYNYSIDEQIQYATFGGAVGLLQGSFPFAVRTGMGWARDINPGAGERGTIQAVAKKAIELTPVAITQGAISAAQVKISGGSNSEVVAGVAIGAAIPFVYSGMMVAFGLPANLKVLTWRDPRFPNEYARVIFYDGIERPYQVYSYRVTEGEPPLAEIRISTPGTLPARTGVVPIGNVKGAGVLRNDGKGGGEMLPVENPGVSRHVITMNPRYHDGLVEFKQRCTDYSTIQQFVTDIFGNNIGGLRDYLVAQPGLQVVDIGVGDGTVTRHLAGTLLDLVPGRVVLDVVEPMEDYIQQTDAKLKPLRDKGLVVNFKRSKSEEHFARHHQHSYHLAFASHSLHLTPLGTISDIGVSVVSGGYVIVVIGARSSIMSALKDLSAPKPAITGADILGYVEENLALRPVEITRLSIPSHLDLRDIELPEKKAGLTDKAKNILSLMLQRNMDEVDQDGYDTARDMILERLQGGILQLDNDGIIVRIK